MSNLSSALQQLRQEQKQAEHRVEKLRSAISVIEGLVGRNGSGANGAGPGRVISAAARRRMALAQKLRWAKVRQGSKPAAGKTKTVSPVKRTLSAATRRNLAAAQRSRWAKFKAAKKAV